MDNFKEFLSEFKERLTNPLFASFIISWLFWNWDIVIGLTLYKQAELKADEYKSYFDLIQKNYTHCDVAGPLILAAIYTLGYPWAKKKIKVWNAGFEAAGEAEIIKKTGEYPIKRKEIYQRDIDFSDLRRKYSELEHEVIPVKNENAALLTAMQTIKAENEGLISSNTNLQEAGLTLHGRINGLESEKNKLNQEIKGLKEDNDRWTNGNNASILNGLWIIEYKDMEAIFEFKDGKAGMTSASGIPKPMFKITSFSCNPDFRVIAATILPEDVEFVEEKFLFLTYNDKMDAMTGMFTTFNVTMKKRI